MSEPLPAPSVRMNRTGRVGHFVSAEATRVTAETAISAKARANRYRRRMVSPISRHMPCGADDRRIQNSRRSDSANAHGILPRAAESGRRRLAGSGYAISRLRAAAETERHRRLVRDGLHGFRRQAEEVAGVARTDRGRERKGNRAADLVGGRDLDGAKAARG